MSDSGQFPPGNLPDWLPAGWTTEVRPSTGGRYVKCYVHLLTGHRFYSKSKVLEYIGTVKNDSWTPQNEMLGSASYTNFSEQINASAGSFPQGWVTKTPAQQNGSKSGNSYEVGTSEILKYGESVAEKSPDWLPAGWTEEVKERNGRIVKTYVDPLWGHRFYSKPQVLQYLGVVTNDSCSDQRETTANSSDSNLQSEINGTPELLPHASTLTTPWEDGSQHKQGASEMPQSGKIASTKTPDWLPAGWTEEVKLSNGRNVKCYIDTVSGRKFYSKTKVLEYLATAKVDGGSSEKKKISNDFDINLQGEITGTPELLPHVSTLTTPWEDDSQHKQGASEMPHSGKVAAGKIPDWLPAGWIEEVKLSNGRNVKCYIDPVSGRKFYSKTKVLEYFATAKIDGGTSEKKNIGNFDINLQGEINVTPELLTHASALTTPLEDGSQHKQEAYEMPHSGKVVAEKTSDWLPAGWTEEVKSSNGRNVKCYIDSVSGRKFYSKKKVLEYLTSAEIDGETSEKKKIGNDFDINLPVQMSDPPEPLPHVLITGLEGGENGSGAEESYKLPEKTVDSELPDGWITEVKHRKFGLSDAKPYKQYIDPVTGRKFSSKQKVFEYLGTITPNSSTSRRKKTVVDDDNNQGASEMPHSGEIVAEKTPDWLPAGWTEEEKLSKGRSVKQYIDPVTGRKFLSKEKVFEYLGTVMPNSSTSRRRKTIIDDANNHSMGRRTVGVSSPPQPVEPHNVNVLIGTIDSSTSKEISYGNIPGIKTSVDTSGGGTPPPQLIESQNMSALNHTAYTSIVRETSSSEQPGKKVVKERRSPQGLPPGWIKDFKNQKAANKTKKIPYYIDPVSGYVFSSLLDAWRYVESGDIRKCVVKPKKREDMGFATDQSLTNVDRSVNNPPSQLLEGDTHINTQRDTSFSPDDGKLSSSKQGGNEANVDKIVSNTTSQLLEADKHVNARRRTRFSPEDGKEGENEANVDKIVSNTPSQLLEGDKHVNTRRRTRFSPEGGNEGDNEANMDKIVSNTPSQLLEGDKHVNTRRRTRFSPEDGKESDNEANVDKIVSNTPSQLLEGAQHVNTRKRTRSSPEDGILSSSQHCDSEPNVDEIVTNTLSWLLVGAEHVNMHGQDHAPKRTRSSPEDGRLTSTNHCDTGIMIERGAAEGLPSGWIKEIRLKIEKLYTDPRSGYVFMSQEDALCYLETGDIDKCAIKPRMRDELALNEGSTLNTDKTGDQRSLPTSSQPKTKKTGRGTRLQQLELSQSENTPRLTRLASQQKETSSSKQYQQPEQSQNENTPRLTRLASQQKETSSSKQSQQLEKSQYEITPRLTRLASRHKEVSSSRQSEGEIVVEKVTPKRLTPASVKEDIQKKTTRARRNEPNTVNTAMDASLSSPQNEMTSSKQSGKKIVVERVPSEGLPPGWIKEVRIQKKADGIRKDVFYTDPVKGYVFSSQKDVSRYVQTGDILSCAMKPKTRDQLGLSQGIPDVSPTVVQKPRHDTSKTQLSTGKNSSSKRSLEAIDYGVPQKRQTRSSVASPVAAQILEPDTSKKQLSTGKKVGSKRSLEIIETDVSPKRRQTRASASAVSDKSPVELPKEVPKVDNTIQKTTKAKKGTKNPTVESPKEVPKVGNDIQKPVKAKRGTKSPTIELLKEEPKVDNVIQKATKTEKANASSKSPLPKAKLSMKKSVSIRSPPKTEKKVKNVETSSAKNSSKTEASSSASKTKKETKKETRKPPSRISKRLLGLSTETVPDSASTEQALKAKGQNSRKRKDTLNLNAPNDVASGKKTLPSNVENSEKNVGIPCPDAPSNVAQALTSEVDNSGMEKNIPYPNVLDDVADNVPQELETVPEMGNTEVEKTRETEDIPCPNAPDDVADNAPQQLETVPELDKTNHSLGSETEAPLDAEVSNKIKEATEEQVEDQTEQPTEVSNKRKEAVEDQAEDQTVLIEKITEVSNKSNEAEEDQAEDQTVLIEKITEVSNKSNEAEEDQAEGQTVLIEKITEVSNKSNEAEEDQAEDEVVSLEQTEVSKKRREAEEDQVEDQTVSLEQPAEVSNQRNEAKEDQAEDQTLTLDQAAEESNKSKEAEEAEDQTVLVEQPAEVSNKGKEAAEGDQAENQTVSQDQSLYQFEEETWSDPCLDFAFKTLTGTLPFEDNAQQVQSMFQLQADTSQVKTADNGLTLLDFGTPNARQVDNSEAQNASEPAPQLPTSSAPLPDMNSSLPSGSETAPQQVDPEENAKNEENVLTLDNYAKFLF